MSEQGNGAGEATPAAGAAPDGNAPAPAVLPLFYKSPQPVNATRHAKFGIRRVADLSFAAATNVLPVGIGEFAIAAKFYPLVFSAEPPHMPVAVCGMRNGENDFVTAGNLWAQNTYVPAYVRRYPFVFMETPDRKQMILCVDEGSGLVLEGGEQPLFDEEGKQTPIVDRALDFCRMYHQQHQATRAFVDALAERSLLSDNTTQIQLAENRKIELKGYKIIDRAKFEALDDATIVDWHKRGWLSVVSYHLQSGSNWPNVFHHAAARAQEKAAAANTTETPQG